MDQVTTAIITALTAGLASGTPKVVEQGLADAYAALKTRLKTRFGTQSDVMQAVDGLEAKPESAGRKSTLSEEVAAAGADRDPEILRLAITILERLDARRGDEQIIQTATGTNIAQASNHSTATVTTKRTE